MRSSCHPLRDETTTGAAPLSFSPVYCLGVVLFSPGHTAAYPQQYPRLPPVLSLAQNLAAQTRRTVWRLFSLNKKFWWPQIGQNEHCRTTTAALERRQFHPPPPSPSARPRQFDALNAPEPTMADSGEFGASAASNGVDTADQRPASIASPSSAAAAPVPARRTVKRNISTMKETMNGPLYMQASNKAVIVRRVKRRGDSPWRQLMRWFVENQIGTCDNAIDCKTAGQPRWIGSRHPATLPSAATLVIAQMLS